MLKIVIAMALTVTPVMAAGSSYESCHKVQTYVFDAMIAACNQQRLEGIDSLGSVCPQYVTDKTFPNWATYREHVIEERTTLCMATPPIKYP